MSFDVLRLSIISILLNVIVAGCPVSVTNFRFDNVPIFIKFLSIVYVFFPSFLGGSAFGDLMASGMQL